MPEVRLTLNDELFHKFVTNAAQEGYQVEEFLSKAIQQHADRLLAKMHKAWMPLVQWDALVRGDQYPLCSEIASQLPLNPNSNICLLSAQAYEERVNLLRAAL